MKAVFAIKLLNGKSDLDFLSRMILCFHVVVTLCLCDKKG